MPLPLGPSPADNETQLSHLLFSSTGYNSNSMEQKVKVPKTFLEKEKTSRVYVLLDQASLETVKVWRTIVWNYFLADNHWLLLPLKAGKEFQLLNSDEHVHQLQKANRDPAEERPDITHQVNYLFNCFSGFLNFLSFFNLMKLRFLL